MQRRGLAEDRSGPVTEQGLGPLVAQPRPAPVIPVSPVSRTDERVGLGAPVRDEHRPALPALEVVR